MNSDALGAPGGVNRQHAAIGTAAAVVSAAVHVALLIWALRMQVGVPIVLLQRREAASRPPKGIRLMDVQGVSQAAAARASEGTLREWTPQNAAESLPKENLPTIAPDESVIQPPRVQQGLLAAENENLSPPGAPAPRRAWEAKQEILAVEKKVVADGVGTLSRRKLARVERVRTLDESALAADTVSDASAALAAGGKAAGGGLEPASIAGRVAGGGQAKTPGVAVGEQQAETGKSLFAETPREVTPMKAIENLLTAEVTVYETLRDWKYGYFRIEVRRVGPETLPVLAKDVVFIQDCSASITEQRLHFCRDGMERCMDQIGPDDRYEVIGFRDKTELCFGQWAASNAANRARAVGYIQGMLSTGETDVLGSIKTLLALKREANRPIVAVMVTDGRPTSGELNSADIIGQFSKLNEGAISIFALGTAQTANSYLLDLLGYCNGGGSYVVNRGRWEIPDALAGLAAQTARPVLHGVDFRFADGCGCDVYPARTGNLYLDRPLVLHGRYPRGLRNVVFQAVGQGKDVRCDMIFNVDLTKAAKTDNAELRTDWALQRVYHLIGEHARTGDPESLDEIRHTARSYGLRVPYRGELQ
jgi:hypothetical protein